MDGVNIAKSKDNGSSQVVVQYPSLSLHSPAEPTPIETAVFDILIELIDCRPEDDRSNVAAASAAKTINSLYPNNMPDDPNMQELKPYTFIIGVWLTMFETLRQIPPQHYAIQRLVDLVAELKKLDVETLNIWRTDIRLWTELPLLAPEFVEQWEQTPPDTFDKSGLKAFRDKLEADGVWTIAGA